MHIDDNLGTTNHIPCSTPFLTPRPGYYLSSRWVWHLSTNMSVTSPNYDHKQHLVLESNLPKSVGATNKIHIRSANTTTTELFTRFGDPNKPRHQCGNFFDDDSNGNTDQKHWLKSHPSATASSTECIPLIVSSDVNKHNIFFQTASNQLELHPNSLKYKQQLMNVHWLVTESGIVKSWATVPLTRKHTPKQTHITLAINEVFFYWLCWVHVIQGPEDYITEDLH